MSKTILSFSSDLGYWCDEWSDMSRNTSYSVSILLGEIGKDKDKILPISKDPYVPQNGDKVFFLPGVNVPRIKFKNLCDEAGIRTVRDVNKANVFVANNNTLNKVISTTRAYKVKTDRFKELMAKDEFISKVDEHHYQKMVDALEFYTETHVFVDRPTSRLMMEYVFPTKREPSTEEITSVLEQYQELVSTANQFIIYDESTIIDQLNGEDAAIIDHVVYEQLKIMLESKDNDNTVLAMEIMANCKYSASLVHLMLLFYHHSNVFYNSTTKNHVNFKSLLSWLDLTPGGLTMNADDCIELLKEKGQLVPDKVNTLLSYIGEDIASTGDTEHFRMKHISLSPELLADMGVNYSYQVQPEYVPPVPEVEDEGPEEEGQVEEIADEDITEAIARIERKELKEELIALDAKEDLEPVKEEIASEEDIVHDLYGVDNDNIETSLTAEPVSNNNQITQTDDSDDFEWF